MGRIRRHFRPKLTTEHENYLRNTIIPKGGFNCCSAEEAYTMLSHLLLGSTARMAARAVGVTVDDFRKMRKDDADFDEACEHLQCAAGHRVIEALYNAASTPDAYGRINTAAAVFWLKNREKEDWTDRSESAITMPEVSPDALLDRITAIVKARRAKNGGDSAPSGGNGSADEGGV